MPLSSNCWLSSSSAATLDGAVKLMLRYQVGKELPQEDVDDIVAFLHSLNGVYTPYMQDKQ